MQQKAQSLNLSRKNHSYKNERILSALYSVEVPRRGNVNSKCTRLHQYSGRCIVKSRHIYVDNWFALQLLYLKAKK